MFDNFGQQKLICKKGSEKWFFLFHNVFQGKRERERESKERERVIKYIVLFANYSGWESIKKFGALLLIQGVNLANILKAVFELKFSKTFLAHFDKCHKNSAYTLDWNQLYMNWLVSRKLLKPNGKFYVIHQSAVPFC